MAIILPPFGSELYNKNSKTQMGQEMFGHLNIVAQTILAIKISFQDSCKVYGSYLHNYEHLSNFLKKFPWLTSEKVYLPLSKFLKRVISLD